MSNLVKLANALPSSIPADGIFAPIQNVVDGTYDLSTNLPGSDSQYAGLILTVDQIVGTNNRPFVPVANSAYIPTLYKNVQHINSTLDDDIVNTVVKNDRHYPTSFAVQKYVQSQLNGFQEMEGANKVNGNVTDVSATPAISTVLTNTVIVDLLIPGTNTATPYDTLSGNGTGSAYMFALASAPQSARVGTTKTIVFDASGYDIDTNTAYIDLGPHNRFLVAGKQYQYYTFTFKGDAIQYIQTYNTTTSSWNMFVTNYQSSFSNGSQYTVSGKEYNYYPLQGVEAEVLEPIYNW